MNNNQKTCIWQPVSECRNCILAGRLSCHCKPGDEAYFIASFLTFVLPAIIGILIVGYKWYLFGWIGVAIIFLVLETRFICSHCPYFAKEGLMLNCPTKNGFPKFFWKYHPEPINKLEKTLNIFADIVFLGYPLLFLIFSKQYIFLFLTIWGLTMFIWTLRKYFCRRCINFSCFLNPAPKEVIDEFLKLNPVMRRAWEEKGWKVEDKP